MFNRLWDYFFWSEKICMVDGGNVKVTRYKTNTHYCFDFEFEGDSEATNDEKQ